MRESILVGRPRRTDDSKSSSLSRLLLPPTVSGPLLDFLYRLGEKRPNDFLVDTSRDWYSTGT